MNEIKKEEADEREAQEYEGGSDSESETDDLEEKEVSKLHKMIEIRNESTKHYSKGSLQWRCQQKKDVFRRQSESEENKICHTSQEIDKKPITSKYLVPIKNSVAGLPPRAKRVAYICPEKEVLVPKTFDIDF